MSKDNNQNHDDAVDYLAQVDWQNRQLQRRIQLPWHMEPKWRYKKITSTYAVDINKTWWIAGITIAAVGVTIGYLGGIKVLLLILVGMLFAGIFIALMIYDVSKKPKDDE
jgi:hypothetical protein